MGLLLVDDPLLEEHKGPLGHPERPERLEACRRGLHSALRHPPEKIPLRRATPEELLTVHEPAYVDTLLAASGQRGAFDADTYYGERSVDVARAAAGGALELTQAVWERRGRGIALLRPPGHHARPGGAMGFCLINHVALAAARALQLGAERVAIVDWDVHHGNGTEEAFYQDPRVLYISLHQHPLYPGSGAATDHGALEGRGFTVNLPLGGGATGAVYGEVFRQIVLPILAAYSPDLLLVSAGFDAHAQDPLGGMLLDDASYGALTRSLLLSPALPVALFLEGGYDLDALRGSVAATVGELEARRADDPFPCPDLPIDVLPGTPASGHHGVPIPMQSDKQPAGRRQNAAEIVASPAVASRGRATRRPSLAANHLAQIESLRRSQSNFWRSL